MTFLLRSSHVTRQKLILAKDWTWFSPGRIVGQPYLAAVAQIPLLYFTLARILLRTSLLSTQGLRDSFKYTPPGASKGLHIADFCSGQATVGRCSLPPCRYTFCTPQFTSSPCIFIPQEDSFANVLIPIDPIRPH